jgi:hypothetical protein
VLEAPVSRSQPDAGTCRAGSHRAPNWRNTRRITNEEISFRAGYSFATFAL